MSRAVVLESQLWENGSDYDNAGVNGRDKIMEKSERVDRQWQLQDMHPTFRNGRVTGSWMHHTSKQ